MPQTAKSLPDGGTYAQLRRSVYTEGKKAPPLGYELSDMMPHRPHTWRVLGPPAQPVPSPGVVSVWQVSPAVVLPKRSIRI